MKVVVACLFPNINSDDECKVVGTKLPNWNLDFRWINFYKRNIKFTEYVPGDEPNGNRNRVATAGVVVIGSPNEND